MREPQIAGLLLAAGASSRMGRPKQLLDWNGQPLVRVVAQVMLAAQLSERLVVIGAAQQEVSAALQGLPLTLVENAEYAQGQSSSLRAGIAALSPASDAVVVVLGDQPFVTAAIVDTLIATWRRESVPIVAACYGGTRGNPVLFSRELFPQLLAIQGDQGAREVIKRAAAVRLVEFGDLRPLIDLDTPEEYARLTSPQTEGH